jgi:hypothetical protein
MHHQFKNPTASAAPTSGGVDRFTLYEVSQWLPSESNPEGLDSTRGKIMQPRISSDPPKEMMSLFTTGPPILMRFDYEDFVS